MNHERAKLRNQVVRWPREIAAAERRGRQDQADETRRRLALARERLQVLSPSSADEAPR